MFFCKKSQFLHTLEIIDFAWDNHVIYRKKFTFFFVFQLIFLIVDESKFHFFQSIFPKSRPRPPLPQCCWENVKKCQSFTYGYFDKNSKNTIINRETVFTKIFEKTRTYRDVDENFQKFAGRLRVKTPKMNVFWWWIIERQGPATPRSRWPTDKIEKRKVLRVEVENCWKSRSGVGSRFQEI